MNGSDKRLKFYCPTHRIRFQATGPAVVLCEQGGHTLGSGFPASSWWEFCCDCGTFWPADSADVRLQRTECLVCERPIAKRYLCNKCQVVSIESSALVRRKSYSIQDSGITPHCPGCATPVNGHLNRHDCLELNLQLLTSRSSCPFCESNIGAKQSSKPATAATAAVTTCPYCNKQQKPGHLFCAYCGKPLADAESLAKSKEEAAQRKAEETTARQKAKGARQQASAEALRVAEEKRRREQEAKRKADVEEKRKAELAEEARRHEEEKRKAELAEKARHQEEEEQRKAELAEKARHQEEERQRSARESKRLAEEAARKTAEREARLAAERKRNDDKAQALAEQEQQRVKELERQQLEHERLAAELHRRAQEEEAQRAREEATTQSEQQSLSTPPAEIGHRIELEDETQSIAVSVEKQAISDQSRSASSGGDPAVEAAPELASAQLSQQASEPDPTDRPSSNQPESFNKEDTFSAAKSRKANEVVKAPEYVHSWDQRSIFTVPQRQRVPRGWLIGLVVLVVTGVVLTVIVMTRRANPDNNANGRLTPSKTGPIIPDGMVLIPGGEFSLGSDRLKADQQEKPAHKVTLAPFYIDTTEVTCEDYEKFVKATGHKAPAKWLKGSCAISDRRKPVTGVDWYAASAFAKWANKRLPTEQEWEFAARGTTGWIYPWGNVWRSDAANADNAASGVVVVATFKGRSPFQCYDMIGNAWEWTASKLVAYPGGKLSQQASDDLRVIRGGSWESDRDSATTTYRFGWPASGGKDYSNTSFRCAMDAKKPEPESVGSRY
jgi:formylglycine-generating enzyme required for sulfatase activity